MKRFISNFLTYLFLCPLILLPTMLVDMSFFSEHWFWIILVGWHLILAYYDPFNLYKGDNNE